METEPPQLLVAPLQVRYERMESIAASPDGNYLATGSFDGLIDLWPGNFSAWKRKACQIVNRNLTQDEWQTYISDEPYTEVCPAASSN